MDLENQIIPCFNYLKSLSDSNGTSLNFTKRNAFAFRCDPKSQLIPNVETLRDAGVPDSKIITLLQRQPRTFMVEMEKFREVVKEVKQRNFNPNGALFVEALSVIRGMSKSSWEDKVNVYRKWGFSEDDINLAFSKCPDFMKISPHKIMAFMDFVVNEIGLDSSAVLKCPNAIGFCLENGLKPKYSVYKILVHNGLMHGLFPIDCVCLSDKEFVKNFVPPYESRVPDLLQHYQKHFSVEKI